MLCTIAIREHRDRQDRLEIRRSLDESKSFCTCPPSGNQVDGLPLAPRKDAASASWPFSGRACMCETRRVFLISGDVSDANVLVNLENPNSYHIKASIRAIECLA